MKQFADKIAKEATNALLIATANTTTHLTLTNSLKNTIF